MSELFTAKGATCTSHAPGYATYVHWGAMCEEINDTRTKNILNDAEVSVEGRQESQLGQYILEYAKILFALADKTDALARVPKLVELNLTDDYLPIMWDATQGRARSLSGAPRDDKALEWFSPLPSMTVRGHTRWIENFCKRQWEFLAPVFTDIEIVHPLHIHCPLPFTSYTGESSTGGNSILAKGHIHPSHWKAVRRHSTYPEADRFGVPVAIKMIRRQHEATDKWVQVEVAALELVRSLHHPHLINFLTSFRQAGNHYLIFDWANGGDLTQFWRTTSPAGLDGQPSHQQSIIWAVEQMTGLVAGLHKLHTEDKNGVHCRHGDLKPANIVRSKPDKNSESKSHGHLLITDMGVAKVNDKATHIGRSSGNLKATIRYQSPEFLYRINPDTPTSRAYDMWSMGCTLLEFIIWLLYGPKHLDTFNQSFPNTTFFSGNLREGIKLNPAVSHWVLHMQRGPLSDDPMQCISTALRRILDFILKRVLIRDFRPELERTDNMQVSNIVVVAPNEGHDTAPNDGRGRRARSGELLQLLEAVRASEAIDFLRELPDGETYPLSPPPQRKPSTASLSENSPNLLADGLLQVPLGNVQETVSMLSWEQLQPQFADLPQGKSHPDQPYVTDYLGDSWDAIPDNELALELFSDVDLIDVVPQHMVRTGEMSPSMDIKNLCERCLDDTFGIFSLRFVCEETVETLNKRDPGCGVCWMLQQHARKTGVLTQNKIKFLRSGSYVMQSALENGIPDKPVFSIIVGPGITAAPKDLQRSFPRLPQAVTDPGREADVMPKPRPSLTITGKEAKVLIMKKWIADCDEKHLGENDQPNCNPSRPSMRLPTRLIYVGKGRNTNLHLDCRIDREQGLKYVALSHRWGYPRGENEWTNLDGSVKSFCTTDDNIEEFSDRARGIDFAAIPKTFRDAVEVTRGLGIQYLWIDSLCIIQDQSDQKDFNQESRRMRDVYSGAYCTIASTGAEGTTDGFLNKKQDRSCVKIDIQRMFLGESGPGPTTSKDCTVYICDAIDDFKRDIDGADMATRGWIFQERALSRRTLHFGKNQMYWECGAGVCCETMTRLFNRRATFMSDPDFPSQAANYGKGMKIRFYETLYQHYSGLSFSVIANRAVAMAGLESKIFTTFQTKGAYGVMDGEFLHRTLLWQRREPLPAGAMGRISFEANEPTPPSWSWMAVRGKITYLPIEFGTVEWKTDILSPFRNTSYMEFGMMQDRQLTPIEADTRDINWNTIKEENLSLDRAGSPKDIQGLKCVVMGTRREQSPTKGRHSGTSFQFPILLIAPKKLPGDETGPVVYERVGVGKLADHEMEINATEESRVQIC